MMRTVMELNTIPCAGLEVAEAKQSIMSSKSFGTMQNQYSIIAEAISSHAARACEKARAQQLVAHRVSVFVRSNVHRGDLKQYANQLEYRLVNPTNDTRRITHVAKRCLKQLFRCGIWYKKVGVMLEDLRPDNPRQQDLFNPRTEEEVHHGTRLMTLMDAVNARFGRHTMRLAAEGSSQVWAMRAALRSPCYTTRWTELPQVK